MSKNPLYLVAVDGSENANRAIDFAADLAKQTKGSLLLAYITTSPSMQPVSSLEEVQPASREEENKFAKNKILAPAKKRAEKKGVEAETWHERGNPGILLNDKASDSNARLIVSGRSGHGNIAEMVLGSVSNTLVHIAKVPVVLVP